MERERSQTSDLRRAARWYHELGFNVLPLDGKAVTGTWTRWQSKRQSESDLSALPFDEATGVGLVSGIGGLVYLDFDHSGFTPVEQVLDALGWPHSYAWVIRSGSGKGYHLAFRCPSALEAEKGKIEFVPSRGEPFERVEARIRDHQTVAPPSIHPDTEQAYYFVNGTPDGPPAEVPLENVFDALEAIGVRKNAQRSTASPAVERDGASWTEEEVRKALEAIPRKPYEDWIKIITATVDALEGDLTTAKEILKSTHPEEEPGEYQEKFGSLLDDVTAGSLVWYARQHGYDPFPPRESLETTENGTHQAANSEPNELSELNEPADTLEWTPFPTEALPEAAAGYVKAHARAKNVDEAMLGVPVLGTLAAGVGNARQIQIKRSWREHSTLWTLIVAPSGVLKTQSYEAAIEPVNDLEIAAKRKHEAKVEQYERKMEEYRSLPDNEKSSRTPPEDPGDRKRYRVSNTTIEALIDRHADNPRGLLLARDELAGWIGSFDQYTQAESDLQSWIEMYEGRLVQSDRKTSGTTDIERPNVSVVGTTQPGVIQKKLSELHFQSGFEARLLMASPPQRERRFTLHDVTKEVAGRYRRLIKNLYDIDYNPQADPPALSMSGGAQGVFVDFYNSNARLQERLPDGPLRSKLSKIEAVAARIALILQLSADTSAEEIGLNAMRRGVLLAKWFRHEAARLHDLYGLRDNTLTRDERCAQELPDTFNWRDVRDVWEIGRRGAMKACNRLVDKGLAVDRGRHKGYQLTERAKDHDIAAIMEDGVPDVDDIPPRPEGRDVPF